VKTRAALVTLLGALTIVVASVVATTRPASALTSSLQQVTNFGSNPSGLQMFEYVPATVAARPAVVVVLHFCTGSGPVMFTNTQYATLADRFGYIAIYPSAPRSGQCFDVSTPQALTRGGGGDPDGIVSMVRFVEQHNNADPSRVFATGISSGAMTTNVLLAEYPDVFRAGSAYAGVPYTCFATTDGSLWNNACANGQVTRTAQQWGDAVRAADPGFSGRRPRMQLWHGTADTTLNFVNFGEEIKQWTNANGLTQTPTSTDSPQSGWTHTTYADSSGAVLVDATSEQGVTHNIPLQEASTIHFFGLDAGPTPTPTPIATPTPTPSSTPTPTPTPTPTGSAVTATPVVSSNSPFFNDEEVKLANSSPLTSLTVTIVIQRTTGVSFSSQFNTVGGQVLQANSSTSSAITYTFTLAAGQTLGRGTAWTFAAQASGGGTTHPTGGDTFTVTSSTGGASTTQSGHF
jgi:acetylxylan esterase